MVYVPFRIDHLSRLTFTTYYLILENFGWYPSSILATKSISRRFVIVLSGKLKKISVSIRKHGKETAFIRACAIRQEKEKERLEG